MASVALAFAGLLVVAYCGVKVFFAVQRLAGELERARRRLTPKQAALRDELEVLNRMTE